MKIQYGSALSDAAQANAFIKIPGLRGMPSREISVKNLASIIQARMSEILAFVTFHLKQVGLDNKMLNGGIVLTGGGSQLKHLIQLTEYATGLNARIGYPNEHLAANHIAVLSFVHENTVPVTVPVNEIVFDEPLQIIWFCTAFTVGGQDKVVTLPFNGVDTL